MEQEKNNKTYKSVISARLHMNASILQHYFKDQDQQVDLKTIVDGIRDTVEDELDGQDNLEATLIRQVQLLDVTYDYFMRQSQKASRYETEWKHVGMALRAQEQSIRTLEKLRKLQKRTQNAERTRQKLERTRQKYAEWLSDAPLDS